MGNFKSLITVLFLVPSLVIFSPPAEAQQQLNYQLREALCRQNWSAAIGVIDRMKRLSPSHNSQLNDYRAMLVNLRNTGARLGGWPSASYCAGNSPEPNEAPETPNPVNTPILLNPQIPPYNPRINPQSNPRPTNTPIQNNNNRSVPTFNQNDGRIGTYSSGAPLITSTMEAPNVNCRWVSLGSSQEIRYVYGYWNCD